MDKRNQTQLVKPAQSDSFLNKKCEIHKELSITVRRTMFTMLAYIVSCAVIIAQPDVPYVLTSSGVQIPVIDVAVNLKAFLLVGPLGLIAITIYLHLFIVKLDGLTGLDEYDKQPFLFNFKDRFSRFLKFLIFYVAPPFLMLGFSWKAAIFDPLWRTSMYFVTIIVASGMFLIYSKPKLKDRQFITVIFLIIGIIVSVGMIAFLSFELGKHITRKLNLERAQLAEAKLPQVELVEANLQFANLSKADLHGANIRGADLRDADLTIADLGKADLRRANLREADLRGANLVKADLYGASLSEANLRGADLSIADLRRADLTIANLSGVYLTGAKLRRANLRGADLGGADLSEANLSGADLSRADLSRAKLMGANLRRAKNLTVEQLCKASTLSGVKFDMKLLRKILQGCPDHY